MEKNIVLIHAGVAVLFILYLFIRILISLFGLTDQDYQSKIRNKFRKSDWGFTILLLLTGLYPILSIGPIELYHLVKLVVLVLALWLSRYRPKMNFTLVSIMSVMLMVIAGYASFTDQPTFPKKTGTFASKYPETASMNELDQGQLIFTTLCVQCHGNDGKLGRFGAADFTQSNLNSEEKIEIVTNGSPLTVMRSFKDDLSSEEIEAVVAYIESLN